MRINIYDNSYTIDWGYKSASYPTPRKDPFESYRGRTATAAAKDEFLWETDKGILIAPEDMATPHLVNALNMIWRNVFNLKNADRPEIMGQWASLYVNRATEELSKELQKRVEDA